MKIRTALAASLATLISVGAHADPIKVRVASHVSEYSPLKQQYDLFTAEVEKRLPGQFDFHFYPSGQIGNESALITNVKAGSIEMVAVASGVMKLDKKLGIFDLPWLFDNREHVRKAMSGPFGEAIKQRVEDKANVKVVGIYENGFRHILNKVRPVKTIDDLAGMKIRVSGGKFRAKVFSDLGVLPQKVAWTETFTALQTGVVDGAEAATYGFYEQKQHEVGGYLSLTSHVYTPSFMLASNSFWGSLSDEQKQVFTEVGQAITGATYDAAADLEKGYLAEMSEQIEVNEVDLKPFQEATRATHDEYLEEFGTEWMDMINAAR
ncbi:MAG: TRAP transporter substrate-binding protein [Oceanospirillales bacterium]|nr:TRAP transporter substrate-binding protein [Oceanospirillales bacterium]